MFDFGFENGYLLSCERMKLCFYFRVVDNSNFKGVVFKDLDLSEIKLLRCNCNFRPIRVGTNIQKTWLIIVSTYNIEIQWQGDLS